MKTSARPFFLSVLLAFGFTLTPVAFAQTTPPTPSTPVATPVALPAPEPEKPTPTVAPAEPAPATPAIPAAPAAVTAPAETPAPAVVPTETPKLRRLDVPAPADDQPAPRKTKRVRHHGNGNELVHIGGDSFLAKGGKADVVVSIFGNSTSEGEVVDSVVSVLGNNKVSGPVGDAIVSVLGNTYVNSKVSGDVVAVLGNVELGPDAEVAGSVVAVGGTVKRDPKAIIHGDVSNVSFGGALTDLEWLHSWFVNCVMYGRLLAFGPHLMWAWWIALGFLAFYVVLALLFGKGLEKCAETLEQRPGYSILSALLTVLLAPVVTIILVLTGVGIAVVPFLAAGLFFAGLFGKAVMLAWLGRRITRLFGIDHPALAVLVGGVILLGLYTVPVLSIVLYKLFGWIGLGVVVYTLMLGMKRAKPPVPPMVPPPPDAPLTDPVTGAPVLSLSPLAPPVISAVTLPRAGFWIRIAALLLDVILVGVVLALVRGSGKMELVVLAVYGAIMWKLRGSTIGGIVCGLKVVRLDDRPLDWSTAVVRALGCFLSFVVMGLGFIWVAFDDQKQSWHDKIAGTTVVRAPKGVSLL
jgi:uncharacterized RDD family membrane protein YckC